jgi:WD40 repeat protein
VRRTFALPTLKQTGRDLLSWKDDTVPGLNAAANVFSPDGRYLVSGQFAGLFLVDLSAKEKQVELKAKDQDKVCHPLAFSADGRLLAGVIYGKKIKVMGFDSVEPEKEPGEVVVWDTATGAVRTQLKTGPLDVLAFSPDNKRIATANTQGLRVWDLKSGKEQVRHKPASPLLPPPVKGEQPKLDPRFPGFAPPVSLRLQDRPVFRTVAFSPDGKSLATGQTDTTVLIWRAEPPKK